MLPENRAFMIRGEDGQEYGPVDLEELRGWVQENRAGLGTEVRHDEPGAIWQPWQYFPELVALLAEVRVTSPVPGLPALVLAPISRRTAAFVLDFVFCFILSLPIIFPLGIIFLPDWCIQYAVASQLQPHTLSPVTPPPPEGAQVVVRIIFWGLVTLYTTGFLALHGRTPAKSLLRVRVVDETGSKPGFTKALLRGLALVVSVYIFMGIPLFYAFFNVQRRTFHDYIAGTYVVEL